MTRDQKRNKETGGVPAGTNGNGGSYAEDVRPAPQKDLPQDDVEHNKQGSFLYPAPPRNPHQFIDFWEKVEVSDEVLKDFERRYSARRDAYGIPAREKKVAAYRLAKMEEYDRNVAEARERESYKIRWNAVDEETRKRQRAAEDAERVRKWEAFQQEAEREVPPPTAADVEDQSTIPYPPIGRSSIRALARAGAMFSYLPPEGIWTEDMRNEVLEHPVDLGLNNVMTVRDIEAVYRLSEINDYLRG